MASAVSVLNLAGFTTAEQQALLVAAKAEVLRRITGRVSSGSSSGEQYSMTQMDPDQLNRLINALTQALGLDTEMTFVRPNFAHCGGAYSNSTGVPDAS